MRYFDLHCDTLYKATTENSDFRNDSYHISIDKAECLENWTQLFAIWIPDEIRGEDAITLFCDAAKLFNKEKTINDRINMHIAVENASMLAGNLNNIELLLNNNVKSVTLTWNAQNELGSGALSEDIGITSFGKDVVKELQKNNIAVDISHSSDKLFYDVVKIAKEPIIATHSNSRTVTNVKRNLTDDQFSIIREMGGIVGLNFYKGFLNNYADDASIDDLILHAGHFLKLGGENTLAIGSDFDGADMPSDIKGLESIPTIYERFVREFGVKITKKIFYDNANMYFANFDNNCIS